MARTGKSITESPLEKPMIKEEEHSKKHNITPTLSQNSGKRTARKRKAKLSPKEFGELQQEWYNKLAESGFEDIERKNERFLKRETTNITLNYSQDTEDFYSKCRSFIHTQTFQQFSTLEQTVWILYSEGFSYDKILIDLHKHNNLTMLCKKKPFSRTKIQHIILNLKKIMMTTHE